MSTTMFSDAIAEQDFLHGLLARLRRRKLLIAVLSLSFFAILFVLIELLPKSYQGVASVVVEGQTPTAVQAGNVLRDAPFDEQTLGTELVILQSRELLDDTIKQTGLLRNPEFNTTLRRAGVMDQVRHFFSRWLPADDSGLDVTPSQRAEADTLVALRKHLKLTPLPRSRVINIAATANSNKLAADIANTIADLYITNHRAYKQAASQEAHQFLDARIGELQRDADAKTRALEQYRIENGLTTATVATLVQEQVSGLSSQLQQAEVRLATLEAQADAAKHASSPEALGAVLQSVTISKYREQEGTLLSEQARLIASYGPQSPMLNRVNAQLGEIRRLIANESARSVSSVSTAAVAERANVDSLRKQLGIVRAQALKTDAARARLQTLADDAASARAVYNDFLGRLRAIDASMAYGATDIRVISHAAPPTHPSFPDLLLMLPASFVLSLAAAGAIGYTTARSKGINGGTEIETLYDIRNLGMIPFRYARTQSLFDSAIQQLLNRLYYLPGKAAPKSIMITSAMPQEGKTTTAMALAEEAHARGIKVFLVDADMRSTRVTRAKTSTPQLGLADVLRGTEDVNEVTQRRGGVPMIPAGTKGNPTRLMALPSLANVMQRLTQDYQLVIVDAPPVLIGGDCEMLSRVVEATVMLAKWQSTSPDAIKVALKQLDAEKLVGGVLTMVDPFKVGQFGGSDAVVYSKDLQRYYR